MRVLITYILVLITVNFAFSQKERKYIRSGNNNYTSEDYSTAESEYAKAMNENSESFEAGFNYGDALYKQKKYDEAAKQFENLAYSKTTKDNKAKAFHNLGNTYINQYKSINPAINPMVVQDKKEELLNLSQFLFTENRFTRDKMFPEGFSSLISSYWASTSLKKLRHLITG